MIKKKFADNILEKFWRRVAKSPSKDDDICWEWQGTTDSESRGRYGRFLVWRRNKKGYYEKAHRFMWMITYGEIPEDRIICHYCDNPPCVRIDHLWLGTVKMNRYDTALKKNRGMHAVHNPFLFRRMLEDYREGLSYTDLQSKYNIRTPRMLKSLQRSYSEEFKAAMVERNKIIHKRKYQLFDICQDYKNNIPLIEISKKYGLLAPNITQTLRMHLPKEYAEIRSTREKKIAESKKNKEQTSIITDKNLQII